MSSKNKKAQNEPAKGKKGGKSKGKKKEEIKLTRVEETFYQLTVADCEKKLNHMRKHLLFLDGNNEAIKEQMRSLHEDKIDTAADMTRKMNAANEEIYEYNEKINELSQEYFDVKSKGDATISDLEEKFKSMHDQLTAKAKLLKAHLNMVNEFPKNEQKLNYINELEEERRQQKEQETKELIDNTERRIKGEREAMRKEIERKMLHVSEEFTRSSTLRNAAYTQRLIRENIALEKEISVLETTWRSTDQHLKEQVARHKEVKATFPALIEKKRELIIIAQQKTNLIEELTSKYENIKAAYVESLLYKTKYIDLVKYQMCGHFQRNELMKQAKKIGTNAHSLKTECLHLETDYERNKQEIQNLKDIIALIRETILKAIGVLGERPPRKAKKIKIVEEMQKDEAENEEEAAAEEQEIILDEYLVNTIDDDEEEQTEEEAFEEEEEEKIEKVRTQSLLEILFTTLTYYRLHKKSTSSLQTIAYDNFLKQHSDLCPKSSDSLREVFKYGVKAAGVDKKVSDQIKLAVPHVRQIIPTERPERCLLFDVEKGTSYYITQSESNPEVMSVEEKAEGEDQDDEVPESSSSYSNISEQTPKIVDDKQLTEQRESKSKLSLNEMPAGTILDVELAEDMEEEFGYERTDRDDDNVYLADADNRENLKEIDATFDEGEEEEMPIYMFY